MEIEKTLQFLRSHRNDLVDYIQAEVRTIPKNQDSVHYSLLQELRANIPAEKNGIHGVLDKVHCELAIAVLEAIWCGWLSQAKANRDCYSKDVPDVFKEIILNAFQIGRDLAVTRP
jgi:hypothetical protein